MGIWSVAVNCRILRYVDCGVPLLVSCCCVSCRVLCVVDLSAGDGFTQHRRISLVGGSLDGRVALLIKKKLASTTRGATPRRGAML